MADEMKHTPGPWVWDLNPHSKYVRLERHYGLGLTVLMFERWGMQGASPYFRDTHGIMRPAKDFGRVIEGREHHASWAQKLDHPDAYLIAAAPDLLKACEVALALLRTLYPNANQLASEIGMVHNDLEKAVNKAHAGGLH